MSFHILLIEDNDSVREVLTRQLETLGAIVKSFAGGDGIKPYLNDHRPDLIIADLNLPDCSGVDIARFAKPKHIPIVLLSGQTYLWEEPSVHAAGFADILEKPVSMNGLSKLLYKHGLNSGAPHFEIVSDKDTNEGPIDMASLTAQMGELDKSGCAVLSRFPAMMRPILNTTLHAAKQRDMELALETAHSLKGAAQSIGAVHLGEICADIEKKAAVSTMLDDECLQALSQEFGMVEQAIEQLCCQA